MAACDEVLSSLGSARPPALEAHVQTCRSCKQLVMAHDLMGKSAVAVSEVSLAKVHRAALGELERHPRPWAEWPVLLGLVVLELAMAFGGAVLLGNRGLIGNQGAWAVVVAVSALLLGTMVVGSWAAQAGAPGRALWPLGLTAVAALAVIFSGSRLPPPVEAKMCAPLEVALLFLPLGFAMALLTRRAYQPARAFVAASSAGIAGLLALHLHCPDGRWGHIAVAHVAPWILIAAVAVVVRRALPSRSFAP